MLVWAKGFTPLTTQLYFNADPVVQHDFRAEMAGLSLGAMDDGLRITTGVCSDAKDVARLSGALGATLSECAQVDIVILKAGPESKYAKFVDHTSAVYESVCVDALEAAGKPLAFCNPWMEPLLRPIIMGPVLLMFVALVVSVPVWIIVRVLKAVGVCGKSSGDKSKHE